MKKVDSVVTRSQAFFSKENILKDYPDVFKGLGSMGGKYHIELDESVESVIHTPFSQNAIITVC